MATQLAVVDRQTGLNRHNKPQKQLSDDSKTILKALTEMCVYRQAVPSEQYLALFSKRLAFEHLPGVLASLRLLGETPRAEGETALPDLGTILKHRPVRTTLGGE